jgi:hypothetical protein
MKESPLAVLGALAAFLAALLSVASIGLVFTVKQSADRIETMVENINGHPLYQPPEPPKKPYRPYLPYNGNTGSTGAIGAEK